MADNETPKPGYKDDIEKLKERMHAKTEAQKRHLEEMVDENARKTEEFMRRMQQPVDISSLRQLQEPEEEVKKPGIWNRIKIGFGWGK